MKILLIVILVVILVVAVYFAVPYSRLRSEFKSDIKECNSKEYVKNKYELSDLPECMQKFYKLTGLDKKTEDTHAEFKFNNVDFMLNVDAKKWIKIDYDEHIFGGNPARLAFIDASMFGVPFQGLDSYYMGEGGMKGVIAKNITIFNQRGLKMDEAALVTWLGEVVFLPSQFLNGTVEFDEMYKNSVKVSVKNKNIVVSGVYKFSDDGRVTSFTTDFRGMTKSDGTLERRRWSAIYGDYTDKNGMMLPNSLKAAWHFDDQKLVYFDGKNVEYTFE